jgi:MFS family permease
MVLARFRPRISPIWRHRDFRRLWIGEAISDLGSSLSHFALPIVAAVTLHVTPSEMGLIRALGAVPPLFIGLIAGAWADRVSRRRLLIALNVLAAALIASVPIAYAFDALSLAHMYALSLGWGLLGPFWWPAWNAFLPSVVEPELRVEANSKLMLTFSSTGITGPGLGGVLIGIMAAPLVLLVDAATFLVTALFVAGVRPRHGADASPRPTTTFRADIVEGLRTTFLDPMQRAITTPRAILDLLDALSATVIVLYILRVVALSPGLMGLAFALSSVGFVAGSLIAPRVERRLDVGGMITLGLFMVAISPYTMVIADDSLPTWLNVLFFAMPGFIGGTGGIIQYVGLLTLRQSLTPERLLGRVTASAGVLGDVMWLVGAALGGVLGETIGLRGAVIVAAVGEAVPFLVKQSSPVRRASRGMMVPKDETPDDPGPVTIEA